MAFVDVLARYPSRPAEAIDREASELQINAAAEVIGLVTSYLDATGLDASVLEPV